MRSLTEGERRRAGSLQIILSYAPRRRPGNFFFFDFVLCAEQAVSDSSPFNASIADRKRVRRQFQQKI
jgi:hypothetical protein